MADVSFKKFSELAVTNSLIAADIIPVVTVTGGNNSKQITYGSLAQTVSASLIGPFTTTITAVEPASAGKWNSTYSTVYANSASWNTGGSTNGFTIFKQISSADPAGTNYPTTVHALSIISGQTNVDIAILSKGTGATLAQIPDDLTTGGAKRGQYATDWQKSRTAANKVAAGIYSTIGGGLNNAVDGGTGLYSVIAGGQSNTTAGWWSTIAGGRNNTASSDYSTVGGGLFNVVGYGSTIAGGLSNTASGTSSTIAGGTSNRSLTSYSTIAGGLSNTASGEYSTVTGGFKLSATGQYSTVGGSVNIASGKWSTIGGGSSNIASGPSSTIVGGASNTTSGEFSTAVGYGGKATHYGQIVNSAGISSIRGDRQSSTFLLRTVTSGTVSAVCTLNDGSEITLAANEAMFVTATIACLSSYENGSSYFGILKGVAKCNAAGNTTLYSTTAINITRFPNTLTPTTLNASLSANIDKLCVVVYQNSGEIFNWNVKLEALSING